MLDLDPPRPHQRFCWAAVGYIDRTGTPRRLLIRAGGWSCPGCVDHAVALIADNLTSLTPPILWFGLLEDRQKPSAARQARRVGAQGRFMASRVDSPAVLVCDRNITPRTGSLTPSRADVAIVLLYDVLVSGPRIRRVDWSESWRPVAEPRKHAGGVRFGVATPDLMDQAIREAGLEPDLPSGLDPLIAAARVADAIEALREARDHTGWSAGDTVRAMPGEQPYSQAS